MSESSDIKPNIEALTNNEGRINPNNMDGQKHLLNMVADAILRGVEEPKDFWALIEAVCTGGETPVILQNCLMTYLDREAVNRVTRNPKFGENTARYLMKGASTVLARQALVKTAGEINDQGDRANFVSPFPRLSRYFPGNKNEIKLHPDAAPYVAEGLILYLSKLPDHVPPGKYVPPNSVLLDIRGVVTYITARAAENPKAQKELSGRIAIVEQLIEGYEKTPWILNKRNLPRPSTKEPGVRDSDS